MFRALIFSGVSAAAAVFAFGNAFEQKQPSARRPGKGYGGAVIAELKANASAAVEKFNKPDGEFRQGDLYVFCFNVENGVFTAHPDRGLLGTDIRQLWEMDGSP